MNTEYVIKLVFIDQLVNGKKMNYVNYENEPAKYAFDLYFRYARENVDVFAFEPRALDVFKNIIDELNTDGRIHGKSVLRAYTFISDVANLINDSKTCEEMKNRFMLEQSLKRCIDLNKIPLVFINTRKQQISYLKECIAYDNKMVYCVTCLGKDLFGNPIQSDDLDIDLLRSTLNYFYQTNFEDHRFYDKFIIFYRDNYNVDLSDIKEKYSGNNVVKIKPNNNPVVKYDELAKITYIKRK